MNDDQFPEGIEPPAEDYDPHEQPGEQPTPGSEDEPFPRVSHIARVAKCSVTFQNSLPMGTRGVFTYEGSTWIAYPRAKNQAMFVLTDRLLSNLAAINDQMIQWINSRPQDAELITRVLDMVSHGRSLHQELIVSKIDNGTK